MNAFIQKLKTRYACNDFDENKKIPNELIEEIIEVFRLSPSMLNIQPWKIFILEDKNVKEKLQEFSCNQKQVGINSHYIIFARKKDFDDEYIKNVANNNEKKFEQIKNFLSSMSEQEKEIWTISQVSIALGNVINFLAQEKIDSCPIGVFEKEKYDEILGIEEKGYKSVFNIALGYAREKKFLIKKERLETNEIAEYL